MNTTNFTIPGRYDRISEVCDFVAAGAAEVGFSADEVFRIQLACDEACTNIIEHAYGDEGLGDIHIHWERTPDSFIVTIRDHGQPFNPDGVPPPNVPDDPDDIDELRIGGLGIHFMRTLMDEVHFNFADGGNRLVMVKHFTGKSSQ
jgi:serine/threonine-protein kinase RsbW